MSELLIVAAILIILLKTWQGWKLGVVRQLVNMGAMVVSGGFGTLGAPAAGAFLKKLTPMPLQFLVVVGGVMLGLALFATINIIGAVLFKKTGDQSVTVVRVGYGLTGAALGAVYGVLMVLVIGMGLRLLGSIADAKLAVEKNPRPGAAKTGPDPMATRLSALKEGVEDGPLGAVLRQVDPVPETTYTTLTKMVTLAASPKSLQRFADYPGMRPLMDNPKIGALLGDPELVRAVQEKRFLALLSNPHLVAAADDPSVTAKLKAIDFEKALDYALQGGSKQ